MTLATALPAPRARPLAGLLDAALLGMVLTASSDALIRLGIQSPVWMVCYALALLRIGTTPAMARVCLANLSLLALPLICLTSALWSRAPIETLTGGAQLFMTVLMAIYLGWRYSLGVLLAALAWVLAAAMALSILHWMVPIFPWPATAPEGGVTGLFSHKNMLGQKALLAALACAAVLLARGGWGWLAMLGLAILSVMVARSMTSILLMPVAGLALVMLARRRLPGLVPPVTVALLIAVATAGLVALAVTGVNPVTVILTALGKSATLTGRTELWSIGGAIIADHPVTGIGYAAFASAPEYLNERLLMVQIGALKILAFHNFLIELTVAAGLPGLIGALVFTGTAVSRLIRLRRRTGSGLADGALVISLTILALSLLGASLYRPHELMIVLLTVFAASAGEDLRAPSLRGRRDAP